MYGSVWQCMAVYGSVGVGLCIAVYGYTWQCRAMHGRACMEVYGRECMAMNGSVGLRVCYATCGNVCIAEEWSKILKDRFQ